MQHQAVLLTVILSDFRAALGAYLGVTDCLEHTTPGLGRLWCAPAQFTHRSLGVGDIAKQVSVIDDSTFDEAVDSLDLRTRCLGATQAGAEQCDGKSGK